VFETSVHGVVVHTRMRRAVRPGMAVGIRPPPLLPPGPRSSATYTLGSSTSSYPCATSWLDSAVPQRAQYGRILWPAVEQPLSIERRQRPPHALHVLGRVGDVRIVVVEPVADPLAQPLPVAAVGEHALAAQPVELGHAELLDVLLAADAQPLLDLDLDRQPVRVPARPCDARDIPFIARWRQKRSLIVRANTWWMPGLAVRPSADPRRTRTARHRRARRACARTGPRRASARAEACSSSSAVWSPVRARIAAWCRWRSQSFQYSAHERRSGVAPLVRPSR
jgi:hypothetical protein